MESCGEIIYVCFLGWEWLRPSIYPRCTATISQKSNALDFLVSNAFVILWPNDKTTCDSEMAKWRNKEEKKVNSRMQT